MFLVADTAKRNQINDQSNTLRGSKEPSIRFKHIKPLHSDVDLSASCPRCLAAAAEKPNGSDGELYDTTFYTNFQINSFHIRCNSYENIHGICCVLMLFCKFNALSHLFIAHSFVCGQKK